MGQYPNHQISLVFKKTPARIEVIECRVGIFLTIWLMEAIGVTLCTYLVTI